MDYATYLEALGLIVEISQKAGDDIIKYGSFSTAAERKLTRAK